jgi:hypothetical protein
MTNKKTDEYKTQYGITSRLNRIVMSNDRNKRKALKDELYDLTNHFWYRKFTIIRKVLQGRAPAKTKCSKIQEVLDTPKEGLSNLLS